MTQRQKDINLLIDIINKPGKYLWIANVPGAFDAAKMLFEQAWDELTGSQAKIVEEALLKSGLYMRIEK
jgi:hypothetical protein